jgi:hypothetical protein
MAEALPSVYGAVSSAILSACNELQDTERYLWKFAVFHTELHISTLVLHVT